MSFSNKSEISLYKKSNKSEHNIVAYLTLCYEYIYTFRLLVGDASCPCTTVGGPPAADGVVERLGRRWVFHTSLM